MIPLSFRYAILRSRHSLPRIWAGSVHVSMVLVSPATRCSNLSCLNSISSSAQSSPRFFCGHISLCLMLVVDLSSMPDFILECLHSFLQSYSSSNLLSNLVTSDSPSSCLFRDANHSAMENSVCPVSLLTISGFNVLVPLHPGALFCAVMSALSRALLGSLSDSFGVRAVLICSNKSS